MKFFVITIILICSFYDLYSQSVSSKFLWGTYLVPNEETYLLNICENNEWFFSTCHTCLVEDIHQSESDRSGQVLFGTYEILDNGLRLNSYIGDVSFYFQIIDSMNMKVLFATNYLNVGDFLNRYSSFFEGHNCNSAYSFSDFYARWTIMEKTDSLNKKYFELLKFSKPGFIIKNDDYEIEALHDSVFKIK